MVAKNLSYPKHTFSAEVEQVRLPSRFSFQSVCKCPFHNHVFFAFFWGDFLVILLFEMVSKCSAEMLFSVPKGKKAVIWLMQKIDKLPSGMSYSTAGHTQS